MKLKAIVNLAIGVALAAGVGTLAAPPAQAVARDGVCEAGEFCYYYNTGPAGSVSDFTTSVSDYGTNTATCYVFKGAGAGQGQCIKNNAAAVKNLSGQTVRIYYNSGYNASYASLDIAPGETRNLQGTALYNNNASHQFLGSTPPAVADAVTRAKSWTAVKVPYSMTSWYANQYGSYRQDCSGYVSMIWNLGYSTTTDQMPKIAHPIAKSDLRAGDVLLNTAAGASGHVLMFDSWADAAHTKYNAYEQHKPSTIYRVVPYPYYSGYGTFTPYRKN
ncbi:MAG: peptidase inhibitor family I36 protein [Actinobacteria bacterium]|nr:peptidase inhibitor family I36 protein [Actinomycetota bacterium]